MLRAAWRVLRNAGACEDVLQGVLLKVWQQFDQIGEHPNPPALLLKITVDAAFDARRKILREARRELGVEHDVSASVESPLNQVLLEELQSELTVAITNLPDQQRTCIWMHCVEGLDYRDIAAALGIDEATVRTHVYRGRRVLKARLSHLHESLEKAE